MPTLTQKLAWLPNVGADILRAHHRRGILTTIATGPEALFVVEESAARFMASVADKRGEDEVYDALAEIGTVCYGAIRDLDQTGRDPLLAAQETAAAYLTSQGQPTIRTYHDAAGRLSIRLRQLADQARLHLDGERNLLDRQLRDILVLVLLAAVDLGFETLTVPAEAEAA